MIKTVIKEITIIVLILIAIALILSIMFYKYIPNNKTVPIAIKDYTLPDEIQQELKESINEGQKIVKTLYLDNSDLSLYESTKEYNKGKANPFADYSKKEENTSNKTNTVNTNTGSSNTSTSENNTVDTNEVYVSSPGKNY